MKRSIPFLIAISVLLSGCSGVLVDFQTETPSPTPIPTTASTATPTSTPTPVPTPTATPTPEPPNNAWQADPIVVSIRDFGTETRNYEPLVQQALDWWEANDTRYNRDEVNYSLQPNATDPDIEIRFTQSIVCGDYHDDNETLGCAPIISKYSTVEEKTVIRIKTGYSNASTLATIKHELGHTLGLEHRNDPGFMRASAVATTLPQTDAADRKFPWQTRDLEVYVEYDLAGLDYRGESAVEKVLSYYEDGADGTLETTPRFSYTDDADTAHIVIRLSNDETLCESRDYVACLGGTYGMDPDDDGTLEYYTRHEIITSDADIDYLSWYIGYYLGFAFVDSVDELPPPFDDRDPKSHW